MFTRVLLLEAAVAQRLAERLVGVLVVDVLADHGDRDLVLRMLERIDRALPLGQVGRLARSRRSCVDDDLVEALRRAATAASCR